MSNDDVLLVADDGPIRTLAINRPAARNALNGAVFARLGDELARAERDPRIRALILTGSAGVFCAGADITALDTLRADPLVGPRPGSGGTVWAQLAACRVPVVAAIEGLAVGGGLELALACDLVVAGRSARFGVPEVRLGVIPGGGGTQRLIRAVGKARAMALLLTGGLIDAAAADRMGLLSDLVDDGTAQQAARDLARTIAGNSPLAVTLAKDAALAAFELPLAGGLEHEKRNFVVALDSDDSREGQQAFLDKRTPEFTGR